MLRYLKLGKEYTYIAEEYASIINKSLEEFKNLTGRKKEKKLKLLSNEAEEQSKLKLLKLKC